MSEKIPFA